MFSPFKTVNIDNGLSLVEPPAGLIVAINNRLRALSDGEGKMSTADWYAIYVLGCLLDSDGTPAAVSISTKLGQGYSSLREVFCNSTAEEFKETVEEFIFSVSRDELEKLFESVDNSCFITRKVLDTIKNDSSPAVTTGS